MRKSVASATAAKPTLHPTDAPMRWVCLALGVAILALAFRIASVW